MINGDTGQPQMSAKPMRVIKSTATEVTLRGYMVSAQTPFGFQDIDMADYGLTVSLKDGKVVKCILNMYDRNVDIEYLKVSLKPQSAPRDSYSTGFSDIVRLSLQLNMAHNTGNKSAGQLCSVLYNEVGPMKQGGRALINLSSDDCQCVGFAFTAMALYYDFSDEDVNSVAAENAYYCLARNIIEKGNSFAAPAIFMLMQEGSKLMKDKLVASWCEMAQRQVGIPIGIMLGGNPFTGPRLREFRQQQTAR